MGGGATMGTREVASEEGEAEEGGEEAITGVIGTAGAGTTTVQDPKGGMGPGGVARNPPRKRRTTARSSV